MLLFIYSTNLVTSGAVQTAIDNALVGGVIYKGTFAAAGQTDYSAITLPVKQGYMYYVSSGEDVEIDGIIWNTGDYLLINQDVAAGGEITSAKVQKIDNTEASDIVRLNAAQAITNKTIDADSNSISNLETDNFKSGVMQTVVRATTSASNTAIASELAVAKAVAALPHQITAANGALTTSGGVCSWTISNSLGTSDVNVFVYRISDGKQVMTEIDVASDNVIVKFNSASDISANAYKAVIVGCP